MELRNTYVDTVLKLYPWRRNYVTNTFTERGFKSPTRQIVYSAI